MNKEEIYNIIIQAVKNYLNDIKNDQDTIINIDTELVSENGVLDSLGLIQVVVEVETQFADRGIKILLTSEKVTDEQNRIFNQVKTLVDYIFYEIKRI